MDESQSSRMMTAMVFGTIAVTVHCAGPDALDSKTTDPASREQMAYLACLIERMGTEAGTICGPTPPQWTTP